MPAQPEKMPRTGEEHKVRAVHAQTELEVCGVAVAAPCSRERETQPRSRFQNRLLTPPGISQESSGYDAGYTKVRNSSSLGCLSSVVVKCTHRVFQDTAHRAWSSRPCPCPRSSRWCCNDGCRAGGVETHAFVKHVHARYSAAESWFPQSCSIHTI